MVAGIAGASIQALNPSPIYPPNMTEAVSGSHISKRRVMQTRGRCSRFSRVSGGCAAVAGCTEGGVARTSTLAIFRSAEPDARVEECVANVRDDLRDHRHEHRDESRRLDHIDVAEQRGIE